MKNIFFQAVISFLIVTLMVTNIFIVEASTVTTNEVNNLITPLDIPCIDDLNKDNPITEEGWVDVGDMSITTDILGGTICQAESAEVKAIYVYPHDKEEVTVHFYVDCAINGEIPIIEEKWIFKLELWGGVTGSKTLVVDDEIGPQGCPDNISVSINLDRDDFRKEIDPNKIISVFVDVECSYTNNIGANVSDSDSTDPYSHSICVLNKDPIAPNILKSDIHDGDSKPRGTYSITVEFTDPDGDYLYTSIVWGDGEGDDGSPGYSPQRWTFTHTYDENDELNKDYEISIIVHDSFGGFNSTSITFTLPRLRLSFNSLIWSIFQEKIQVTSSPA